MRGQVPQSPGERNHDTPASIHKDAQKTQVLVRIKAKIIDKLHGEFHILSQPIESNFHGYRCFFNITFYRVANHYISISQRFQYSFF